MFDFFVKMKLVSTVVHEMYLLCPREVCHPFLNHFWDQKIENQQCAGGPIANNAYSCDFPLLPSCFTCSNNLQPITLLMRRPIFYCKLNAFMTNVCGGLPTLTINFFIAKLSDAQNHSQKNFIFFSGHPMLFTFLGYRTLMGSLD